MIINVGSENPVKIEAVRGVVRDYELFADADIFSVKADSGVSEQPMSLEETVQGAVKRAKNSFRDCDYSFGLESGLMEFPETKTGYMDVCVCAVYDGKRHYLGSSCAFEFPVGVTKKILEEGIDANEAFFRCGLTSDKKVGSAEGAVGILTKGRVKRIDYTKQAIQMAMIQLENRELYGVLST